MLKISNNVTLDENEVAFSAVQRRTAEGAVGHALQLLRCQAAVVEEGVKGMAHDAYR